MSTCTIGGLRAMSCTVDIPSVGVWYADGETDGDTVLSGACTIVLADLSLTGTIISGGVRNGRGVWRVAGGKGKWSMQLPHKSYHSSAGVKYSTILSDVVRETGETLEGIPSGSVGEHYVRNAAAASHVMHAICPAWYVDTDGSTRIGARAATTYTGSGVIKAKDSAQTTVELAADSIAQLVPGVTVDGIEAKEVRHKLDKRSLRTTIYGTLPSSSFAAMVRASMPDLIYRGVYEYRVTSSNGTILDLQPTRSSLGLPGIASCRYSPGIAGGKCDPKIGSLVLVAFANADPARPIVVGFGDPGSAGFEADEIRLCAGSTGSYPNEHATSAESMLHLLYAFVDALANPVVNPAPFPATPLTPAALRGVLDTTVLGALAAMTAGVPTSSVPTPALSALSINLAAKVPNVASSPMMGWPNVRGA